MSEVLVKITDPEAPAVLEVSEPVLAEATVASPRYTYEHVLRAATRHPWAIMPEVADEIAGLLSDKTAGVEAPQAVLEAYGAISRPVADGLPSGVAVLPLAGVITQRASLMSQMSGATSTAQFTQVFRRALADPTVQAIVIDVDSPGGSVFGVDELASEIRAARGQKPIVAVANSLMASAAYWIASQADEVVSTTGGQVGSVGVVAVHTDRSQANEMAGVRPTVVTAGRYKAEGSEDTPLSAEAQDHMQSMVDTYYGMFVRAVAAGRGVGQQVVRDSYGEGRVFDAQRALKAGMIDRVETLDQTIARLASPAGRAAVTRRRMAAEDEPEELETMTPTKRQAEQALRDVGLGGKAAKAILARGWAAVDAERDVPDDAEPDDAPEGEAGNEQSDEGAGMATGHPVEQARRRLQIALVALDI